MNKARLKRKKEESKTPKGNDRVKNVDGFWSFMSRVFSFFDNVLKDVKKDHRHTILWGFGVLLLAVLIVALFLGLSLTPLMKFIVIVLIVLVLVFIYVYTVPGKPQELKTKEGTLTETTPEMIRPTKLTLVNEIDEVIVGTNPMRALITPNGVEVYVSNFGSDTVSVIDTATNGVTQTISVGHQPSALAVSPDGSQVYVGNNGGNVSVIDTATKNVSTIFTDGPVRDLIITPDGRKIYLAMEWSGLKEIDTSTNAVNIVSKSDRGLPEGVAVTKDGKQLYVSYQYYGPIGRGGRDAIGVFDIASEEMKESITGFPNVGGPIAISPNGNQVWVDGSDACSAPSYDHKDCPIVPGGVINIIDITSNKLLKTLGFHLDYGTGFISFLPDSTLALIGGNYLKMIDTKTFVISQVVLIPVSGSIAFARDGRHLYAPAPNHHRVKLLELSTK